MPSPASPATPSAHRAGSCPALPALAPATPRLKGEEKRAAARWVPIATPPKHHTPRPRSILPKSRSYPTTPRISASLAAAYRSPRRHTTPLFIPPCDTHSDRVPEPPPSIHPLAKPVEGSGNTLFCAAAAAAECWADADAQG
ncbi:hypothetical protein BDZ91DRAFT_807626 [Kalaharituber pfeilii]|nr:hypothetical protein BDZ91DRAFT_807626 [Kalaharituber pfeilii]